MSTKSTLLTIWVFLLFVTTLKAQIISVTQTLESIAPDAEVDVRLWVDKKFSRDSKITNLIGNHALIIPPSANASYADNSVLRKLVAHLATSPLAVTLMESAFNPKNSVELRLFFDVPLENGRINWMRPMWENDKMIRHELLGAFHAEGGAAIISLNNHQSKDVAAYTFAHELFHLLDNNRPTGDFVDTFLAEYRALLAETEIYLQAKNANKKSNAPIKDFFMESRDHEALLSRPYFVGDQKVDEKKIFNATLDLIYPANPQFLIKTEDEDPSTYSLVRRALIKILNGQEELAPTILEFSSAPEELSRITKKNEAIRERIKQYFSKKKNEELLEYDRIYNISGERLNSSSGNGGGTRPRTGPGG